MSGPADRRLRRVILAARENVSEEYQSVIDRLLPRLRQLLAGAERRALVEEATARKANPLLILPPAIKERIEADSVAGPLLAKAIECHKALELLEREER